jgi:Fe-S cluster assembly protein SufD
MAAFAFTPKIQRPPIPVVSTPTRAPKLRTRTRVSLQPAPTFSDPFVLQLAETLEDSLPSSSPSPLPLQKLRDTSSETLLSTPWPSRKDEPFRFTDTSFIRHSQISPITQPPHSSVLSGISSNTQFPNLVIADGYVVNSANLSELPSGVFVGSLLELSDERIIKRVCEFVCNSDGGDLFWSINGIGAPDLTVVYVPAGCKVENPVCLRYISVEGSDEGSNELPVSNPRVFVLVEKGGEILIVEEFQGKDVKKSYWTNSVLEVVVEQGGKVRHSYIQNQSLNAAHIKWTSVQQVNSCSH